MSPSIRNELALDHRNHGADLLRIAAMLMVTVMHALVRGGVIFGSADIGLNFYLCWCIQALCEVATNCFFFISGYFLIPCSPSPSRAVNLWCTVLFYSWGIYGLFCALGLAQLHPDSPLLGSLLPISTNNYWFVNSYLALIFLAPYMNLTVRALSKEQLRRLVLVLLALFSLWPVVVPMVMTFEHHGGIGLSWSLVVYLAAAYLRLHARRLPSKGACLAAYVGCCALALIARFLFVHFGNAGAPALLSYANVILTYNSPLIFIAAGALFLFFLQLDIRKPALVAVIRFFAPTVLAAYLITEQHNLGEYFWTKWIPMRPLAGNWWFIPYLFGVCLAVMLLCCLMDRVRCRLFGLAARLAKPLFPSLKPKQEAPAPQDAE